MSTDRELVDRNELGEEEQPLIYRGVDKVAKGVSAFGTFLKKGNIVGLAVAFIVSTSFQAVVR
jgi:hypothetical protein